MDLSLSARRRAKRALIDRATLPNSSTRELYPGDPAYDDAMFEARLEYDAWEREYERRGREMLSGRRA